MAECVERRSVCLRAGEEKPWGFNFALRMARRWANSGEYPAGALGKTRPSTADKQTGYQYASAGGVAGGLIEPRWPTGKDVANGKTTVQDGSILWTAEAIATDSLLEQIETVEWTIPAGIEFDQADTVKTGAQQSSGGQFRAASNAARDAHYFCKCDIVTTLGNEYFAELEIEVHA